MSPRLKCSCSEPSDASHYSLSLSCNYARNCSDKLNRRRLHVLNSYPVAVENQRSQCHLWQQRPLGYLSPSDFAPPSLFIIASLILSIALLLQIGWTFCLPAIWLDFHWIAFPSSPSRINWISTGYCVLLAQERRKKLLSDLWPTDAGQHYLLPLVHKSSSLPLNFFAYTESALHLLFFLLCRIYFFPSNFHWIFVTFSHWIYPKIYVLHGICSTGIFFCVCGLQRWITLNVLKIPRAILVGIRHSVSRACRNLLSEVAHEPNHSASWYPAPVFRT
jgi:hypothetical protein